MLARPPTAGPRPGGKGKWPSREPGARKAVDSQYKWTVLTVTTVGVLMSGLDSRIVVIGLPVVAAALHADAEQAIWFTQGYVLGSTVALLFIGRVSDMFGRVKIYSVGFTIFTVGSLLTGLSLFPEMLIVFRMLQGLGASALFANSAAIITDAFPTEELGLALGTNQVAFRIGSMGGLTLSGLILLFLDWRYLFFVNVPIGIFGTVWAYKRLHEVNKPERGVPMDWYGFATFTTFISALLLSLTLAAYGISAWWLVAALLALAGVSIAGFARHEGRIKHPLLDLGLLHIREFTGGVLAQLLGAMAWGAFLLVISLYFQLVQGYTPFQAGLAILPFDFAFLLTGPVSGKLSDRYGIHAFTTSGLALISLSLFAFSQLGVSTSYAVTAVILATAGAGTGMFASPNISSIMGSVPSARRGVASGLRATFFNVGYTVSFNIVLLVMTLSLPYALISQIISSSNLATISTAERMLFAQGLRQVYLWTAMINAVAIVPSVLRGRRVRPVQTGTSAPPPDESLPSD